MNIDSIFVDGSTRLEETCLYDDKSQKFISTKFTGKKLTNNDLEWYAVLLAVRYYNRSRRRQSFNDSYIIFSDSKLVVNQYNGNWKCNTDRFREIREFVKCEVEYGETYRSNTLIGLEWLSRKYNIAGIHIDDKIKEIKK